MKKLLLLFAAILMASTGMWAETVDYLYPVYNTADDPTSGIKEWRTGSVDATVVTDAATPVTWGTAGTETWYVVTGTNVTLSKGAICSGNVHLILADGAKLTATGYRDDDEYMGYAGIQVSGDGNSLTIYGQTAQTGQLEANGGDGAAGIGGKTGDAGSNITINGGVVTAQAPNDAGIGGGDGGAGFNITINRGIVTANGGNSGAGIGGGSKGNGYNITINGGTVTAKGGSEGAGIGGGFFGHGSNITINGGTVTANGNHGAGIGGGSHGNGSNITINGGTVTATSDHGASIGNGYMASTPASNIKVATKCIVKSVWEISGEIFTEEIATGRSDETDIADDLAGKKHVTIETASACVTYIDENGKAQEIVATEVWGSITPVTLGEANTTTWYIANEGIVLLAGAICQGDVRLILADGAILTATGKDEPDYTPGIQVSGGNSLTIYGQANQSGLLEAKGGKWAAGIGGGHWIEGTNITINGGTVTANGGEYGAGIGGGEESSGYNITINGGTITANGGSRGAGIGGGYLGVGSNITINGGTITANGGGSAGIGDGGAAGIGGGYSRNGSNITINGGTITANGAESTSGIGGGSYASCSNIHVATSLQLKAGSDNPPMTEINNEGEDLDRKLNGKRYAVIFPLQPIKDAAIAAIDAVFEGVTNENVKYFATTAKTSIEAATSEKAINSIKEKALTDLQNALAIYEVGKTAGFGTLSEKQNGPALIVTDKDDKEIILYSPKSVEYIKINNK